MTEKTEAAEVVETEAETTADVMSVSEMFNASEVEASEATTVDAKPEAEDEKGEVEVEAVEEVTAEVEAKAETPSAEQGQLAAMLAERDKRKKAESELAELKAKMEPESKIDPIEDPEGYVSKIEADRASDALKTKITLSQSMMTELDPDYVRLEGVFKGLIADDEGNITDEGLVRKFQQSDNPAKFARDYAKEHESTAEMKDPKYRENLEATIRADILAEIAEKAKAGISVTDVPNLTKASAAGTNSEKLVPEPTIAGMFP